MIVIVDSGGANLMSLILAIERLGKTVELTKDPEKISQASHVILPGVGTAHEVMKRLLNLQLDKLIPNLQQAVLGICVGMQILYQYSQEGNTTCLGIFPGEIELMQTKQDVMVPHMGWNQLQIVKSDCALLKDIKDQSYVYFVHSYAERIDKETQASVKHGETYTAVSQYRNFYGTQFHPERSGELGSKILRNFFEL